MVYWHIQTGELIATNQPLKVNLIVYDNDVMLVTGTSFYLWVLENFQSMASEVKTLISEVTENVTEISVSVFQFKSSPRSTRKLMDWVRTRARARPRSAAV